MRPSPHKKSPSASIQESASDATVRMSLSLHSFVDLDFAEDEYERPRPEYLDVLDPAQYATYYLANHRTLFNTAPTAVAHVVITALASCTSLTLLSDAHSSSESVLSTAARALHGHRDVQDDVEVTPKLSSSSAARAPSWIRQIDDALALDSPVSDAFFRLAESTVDSPTDAETDLDHATATAKKARRASSVEYSYATRQAQVGPPRMRKDSLPRKLATKLGRGLKDFFNAAQQPPPLPPVPPIALLAPQPMRRAISSQP